MSPTRSDRVLEDWDAMSRAFPRPARAPRSSRLLVAVPRAAVTGLALLVVAAAAVGIYLSRPGPFGPAAGPTAPAVVGTATPAPTATSTAVPTATPAPTATATPTPSPSPTTATLTPCDAADLVATVGIWEGAAGSVYGTIQVTSTASGPCTIPTLGLQLIDAKGAVFLDSASLGAPATLSGASYGLASSDGSHVKVVARIANYCAATPTAPITVALVLPAGGGRVAATTTSPFPIDMPPCNGPSAPLTFELRQSLERIGTPGGWTQAEATAVRVGTHETYDRIAFEYGTGRLPTIQITSATPPFLADPSGQTITVAGHSYLRITLTGIDWTSAPYGGQKDFTPAYPVLTELRQIGDFEGVQTWIVGLTEAASVQVFTLTSPTRLVIDLHR